MTTICRNHGFRPNTYTSVFLSRGANSRAQVLEHRGFLYVTGSLSSAVIYMLGDDYYIMVTSVSINTRLTVMACNSTCQLKDFQLNLIMPCYTLISLLHIQRLFPSDICTTSYELGTKKRIKFRFPEDLGHIPCIVVGVNVCVQYNGTTGLVYRCFHIF